MMFTVYIIQSLKTGRYYIGQTQNLEKRLARHNSGQTISLKNRGPFIVVYTETYPSRKLAYQREQKIKSYKGGVRFKNLIKLV